MDPSTVAVGFKENLCVAITREEMLLMMLLLLIMIVLLRMRGGESMLRTWNVSREGWLKSRGNILICQHVCFFVWIVLLVVASLMMMVVLAVVSIANMIVVAVVVVPVVIAVTSDFVVLIILVPIVFILVSDLLLLVRSLLFLLQQHLLRVLLFLLVRLELVASVGQDVQIHGFVGEFWILLLLLLLFRTNAFVKDFDGGRRYGRLLLSIGVGILLFGIHRSRLVARDSIVLKRNWDQW